MANATVIDSLVVTLGLDPANFTKGQKEAVASFKKTQDQAASTAKDLEARGAQGAAFFGQIKKEALSLFAVLVGAGGIEQFTTRTVTGMNALGRQAKLMGVAASDLQAFKMMIDRTGASGDAAAASFTNLAEAMETWRVRSHISPDMLAGMNRIGGQDTDSALQIYEKFAAWAKGQDPQLANNYGKLLGLDPGSIAMALNGRQAVEAGMGESRALGVPTDGDVAKVTALQQAFVKLKQAITGDANAMLYDASPILTGFLNLVNNIAASSPAAVKAILAVVAGLTALGAVSKIAGILRLLGIAGPANAIKGAGAVAGEIAGPVVGAVARVAGPLGAAYALLHPTEANAGEDAAMHKFLQAHDKGPRAGAGLPTGVMAGLYAESHLNPNAINPTSGAEGVGQWLGKRVGDFKRVIGRDLHGSSLADQLKFVAWELGHTEKRAGAMISGAGSDAGALDAFIRFFERPKPGGEMMGDMRRGRAYLASMGHGGGGGSTVVNIGTVTVQTAATDAKGIAGDISRQLRTSLTRQANTGLTG